MVWGPTFGSLRIDVRRYVLDIAALKTYVSRPPSSVFYHLKPQTPPGSLRLISDTPPLPPPPPCAVTVSPLAPRAILFSGARYLGRGSTGNYTKLVDVRLSIFRTLTKHGSHRTLNSCHTK
jgi:hypothetical protein